VVTCNSLLLSLYRVLDGIVLIIVPAVGSGLGDRRVADRLLAGARDLPANRRDQLVVHPATIQYILVPVNFRKVLLHFVISLFLLTGQFSDRNTAAFKLSLSCSSSLQSNSMWSTVCSPFLQKHIGLSRILYPRQPNVLPQKLNSIN
jgi:hypothetical protein